MAKKGNPSKEDVINAIKRFDAGERPTHTGTSRTRFLVFDGKKYNPRAIYALATGLRPPADPDKEFHSRNNAEKQLNELGFTIKMEKSKSS